MIHRKKLGSHMVNVRVLALTFLLSLGAMLAACSNTNSESHRESVRDQNEANVNAETQDLLPAVAQYAGTMTMNQSGQVFEVNLDIKTVYETARPGNSEDPTQTVTLPKLSGNMKFSALDGLAVSDYSNFSEIINPMGGFSTVLFDYGDFDPKTHIMILPYNVNGYSQGNFGELQGILKGGTYTGTWFAKPLGDVGKFDLVQNSQNTTPNTQGGD